MAIELIHGDAAEHSVAADIMLTDPPFDMSGQQLAGIVARYDCNHVVLISTMRQAIDFIVESGFVLAFDFVLDTAAPKKSKSVRQPHYTHCTGVYLHKPGVKSVFDRKRRQRSDVYESNGYWPTIIRAPRERAQDHALAKNVAAITDILGSFDVRCVVDPFAGSGTTALAAFELGMDCVAIERDRAAFKSMRKNLRFVCEENEDV